MDSDTGGLSPSPQRESAAEIARKKVLAVYSSTMESLKKTSPDLGLNSPYVERHDGNEYIAPPVPGIAYAQEDHARAESTLNEGSEIAGNDYEQINPHGESANYQNLSYEPTRGEPPIAENVRSYQSGDATSALKDLPINQTAVDDEWQRYHSAWQNYYQNYYSDYYAKAAQNYLATEKLKSERIATGQTQKKRRARRALPVAIIMILAIVFLFLQYNRLIFAPIMAYVSPNSETVSTSIEAVNPNVTQAVSPEPRLIIPKLNIDVPVAFNISTADVNEAMNHGVAQFKIPGADALPGQIGNLVLSGHSAGDIYSSNPYKFIFSGLERLAVGDLMYINYESVRYTYQMTKSEVVEPTDVAALIYDTDRPVMTLITCTPLGTSRYRLLITAEQISPAYESLPGNDGTGEDQNEPTIPSDTNTSMPANEPSFFENIWNGIFGS